MKLPRCTTVDDATQRSPLRCLVADDDMIVAKVTAHVLRRVADVSVVTDGKAAILAVDQAYGQQRPFDLVLMDVYMPRIDGLAAIRAIRTCEQARGLGIRLRIAISSVARSPQLMQLHVGGLVDAYFVKPLDPRQLYRHMREWHLIETIPGDSAAQEVTRAVSKSGPDHEHAP